QRVGVKRVKVDLAQQPGGCEVGRADAHGVAMGSLGEVECHDRRDAVWLRLRLADDAHAANHVRVDPSSAHVLANSVDHQHVEILEGYLRHQPPCLVEQLRFCVTADL